MEKFELVLTHQNIDWCQLSEVVIENYFLKVFFTDFEKSKAGKMLKICGELGEFKVFNVSFEESAVIGIFPDGSYISNLHFHDEYDDNIFNLTYWSRIQHK